MLNGDRGVQALVVPLAETDEPEAITLAQELRDGGCLVELDVRLRGVKSNLRHADRHKIPLVIITGEREREEGRTVLRDMRTRQEQHVERARLAEAVKGLL